MELPYQQYFDSMPCYVTVQDRDLRVIAANSRFRRSFGNPEGRYCFQVYKQRPEKCEICPVELSFRDGQSHSSEEKVRCLDGKDVAVIVYSEPIRDASGQIVSVMEVSTDITALKGLQQQLRESQERYHSLFEEVPCYISIQDRDLNIVDANRLHRRDFGTYLGCKCYEVYKHRTEECYPCPVRDSFVDGRIHDREEVVTSIAGDTMNVLVNTSPIYDASGRIRYVMEMSTDITQIRQLQSQLASIGLLISSISHGIKGSLNGLNGGIYLVNKGLESGNQARLKQGWEIVLRNVSRIRSMVLDILYYAKDRQPDYEQLSPQALAEDTCGAMRDKAKELKVELGSEILGDPGVFEGDAKAIRAMLVNLLENSLDACRLDNDKDHHGVQLRVSGSEAHVRFEIQDNGIGMDRETREKAFTLFFSSKRSEGTGLGLFIAHKIVKAHGGKISVQSDAGVGTCFLVEIPRARLDRMQPGDSDSVDARGRAPSGEGVSTSSAPP